MCKENKSASKKVAKVFIKAVKMSNYETVSNYLCALWPFLEIDDSLKPLRLEWVIGVPQLVTRRSYNDRRLKYGLEVTDRVNDYIYNYWCPLLTT